MLIHLRKTKATQDSYGTKGFTSMPVFCSVTWGTG